jgi:Rps23 Pro-64 3,4-dihydroxylase Tpa1-like proline 4-hydroxylase
MEHITGIDHLLPDPQLYAGGVSMMVKGSFLNPHLDNSHDAKQKRYRVLNSLYYVTPDWRDEHGGNLELWDQGPGGKQRTIVSRFNRLVLMATDRSSWHSVSPVAHDGRRTCVSNYYFREQPLGSDAYFHATSFRGRPEQPGRDLLLRADNALRTAILSVVNVPTKHIYKPRP